MKQSEKDFLPNGIKRTSTKKGYYEYLFVLSGYLSNVGVGC